MTITVRAVRWDDPVAVVLREAMVAELRLCSADRFAPDLVSEPEDVAFTAVAYNRHGLPVGHVALCQVGPTELEVEWLYVMPPYRGRGVARPLLATAERVAAELGSSVAVEAV